MDKNIEELIKRVIKEELGELVSHELELRFKPIAKQIDTLQISQDTISKQLTEDRRDLNQAKIDVSKIAKTIGVVLENQNIQEDKMVETVKTEIDKIPGNIKKSVENMFEQKSFLVKIKERFLKRGGK